MKTAELSLAILTVLEKMPGFEELPDIDRELVIQDLTGIALDHHEQKLAEKMPGELIKFLKWYWDNDMNNSPETEEDIVAYYLD